MIWYLLAEVEGIEVVVIEETYYTHPGPCYTVGVKAINRRCQFTNYVDLIVKVFSWASHRWWRDVGIRGGAFERCIPYFGKSAARSIGEFVEVET